MQFQLMTMGIQEVEGFPMQLSTLLPTNDTSLDRWKPQQIIGWLGAVFSLVESRGEMQLVDRHVDIVVGAKAKAVSQAQILALVKHLIRTAGVNHSDRIVGNVRDVNVAPAINGDAIADRAITKTVLLGLPGPQGRGRCPGGRWCGCDRGTGLTWDRSTPTHY